MDKLNLEIGWEIDNNQLKAGLEQSRKSIEGVGQTIEVVEDKVNTGFSSNIQQANLLAKNWESLKIQAESYARIVEKSLDPEVIIKYNNLLQETKEEMAKIKAMGLDSLDPKVSPQKWNGLQNSINQVARELPAFTYSAQTGFMAISNNIPILIDELNRLKAANVALTASGGAAVPVWKQFVKGIFSWQTAMMVGITLLTVYGKEIGNWISSLFSSKKALDSAEQSLKTLNKALEDNSFSKAIQDVERLRNAVDMAKKGFVDKKSVVEEYNKTIGKTTGEVKTLDKVERFLIDNADNYIKMMMYKAAANLALADAAKEAVEAEKTRIKELKDFTNNFLDAPLQARSEEQYKAQQAQLVRNQQERKDKEIKIHEDAERKQLDISNKFMKQAQEYASKMNISVFGDDPEKEKDVSERLQNLYQTITDGRRDVLNKVRDLDKEYARKSMESDEAELQALKDKFNKFRRIIEEENEKISRYNKKYKDKAGFKAVDLLDVGLIDPIEDRATDEVTYKQGTAKIAKDLEAKKKIFAEYEDYRSKLGKEKADERYKADMGGFERYIDYLEALAEKEVEAISAVNNGTGTAGQQERSKLIEKETTEAVASETKKQTEVLALMITYDQKRKKLISDYETQRAKYIKTATVDEIAEYDRRHVEELNQLDDSNIQKLQSVKDLFDGIERLTDSQARKILNNVEALLASGINVSPELLKKLKEALKDATKALDERLPERVMLVANSFRQMGDEIGTVNEGLGSMLTAVGGVLAASVQIGTNFRDLDKGLTNYEKYKTEKSQGKGGGLLGGISAIAGVAGPIGGIVSAVAGVASGVIGFFNAAKESARQAEKQLKEYQQKIMEGELEYNRLIRERARSQQSVNEMTLTELKLQQQLLETQLKTEKLRDTSYDKKVKKVLPGLGITVETTERVNQEQVLSDYEYALAKILNEGTEVTGMKKEKYGGFLGIGKKTRLVEVTASLAGKTYEDLEKLYTEGKMNEATKAMFENLKKAKEEVDDINELMKEIDEQIMDKMSGSVSSSNIASSIIQGFREGKRAVIDFGDDVNEIVQNALLSAMSATVLEEPLQELVKKFREDSKDGLTNDEIEAFKKGYGDIVKEGLDALKIIEGSYGTIKGENNSALSSGRINRTISEDTGSSILSFERSRYDLAKQQLQAVLAALDFEKKSYDQILESVRYLKAIEQNTKDTVVELKSAVVELKSINKNTSPQSTRAYGG
ncbi:hypothetical protein [Sphingobacterium multivorum]|uniref:hypothetical protein n=1 Tax=Sphingobacterium multivorum TaxID=28454 RepID=UPI0028ABE559|nr:hypothetical protein [Sphingobacterium multivorum]